MLTLALLAAAPKDGSGVSGEVLLLGSAALLGLGVIAALLLVRQLRPKSLRRPQPSADLQDLVFAALTPAFREYLHSSATVSDKQANIPLPLERLRHILLEPPETGQARLGRDEIAVGLAVLEARLNSLVESLDRVERTSITHDRLLWTVIGALATILGLLAGLVGLVAGIGKLT